MTSLGPLPSLLYSMLSRVTCGTEVSDLAVMPAVTSPPPIFPQDSCVTRGRPRHISHSVWPDTGYRTSFFGKRLHNTTVCRAKTNCLHGQTEPLAENKIHLKKPIDSRPAFSIGKLLESFTVRFVYQQNHYISCNYTGAGFGDRPMLRKM